MNTEIVGLSFCIDPGHAAYVPLTHDYPGAPPQLERARVLEALKPLLEDPDRGKLGHHLKFDMHVLENYGISLRGQRYDTMLESYVWNSTATNHSMDAMAQYYLHLQTIRFEDVCRQGRQTDRLQPGQHRARRRIRSRRCRRHAATASHALAADRTHAEPRAPLHRDRAAAGPGAAAHGAARRTIDREMLRVQSGEISRRLIEIMELAHREAGQPFNLESPKQLQQMLFERLQLPVLRKTPSGTPSTGEDVLEELADTHPLPRMILEYRGLAKLRSTYTEKLPESIDPSTGRVHTSYHQAVAATGRLSSNDPNLQNIPIRRAEGRRIRQAFIADPGFVLLAADYSQIELRIMAHLSGDEGLLRAFAEDRDIHQATAAEVFGRADRCGVAPISAAPPRPSTSASSTACRRSDSRASSASRAARRSSTSTCISRAIRVCGATWSVRVSRRATRATSKPCSAGACSCPTSAHAIVSCSSAPNAPRSTRPCRAPPPISSSAP